jgi:acetoin utilization protein AcuB
MIAPELISDSIPPLHLEDSGEHALITMQEFNVSQLPVLDGMKYVGFLTFDEVISLKHLSHNLKSFHLSLRRPFVLNTAHIFDVMKAAVDFNVKIVPVVDEDNNYLGLISAETCLRAFATLNSVKDAGAIIELEIGLNDYTLSEVARIAEDNNATILCFYTNIRQQDAMVEITIKLNTTDVSSLVSAFERYEYMVKAIHNDVQYTEEIKERYDALMRYLNV